MIHPCIFIYPVTPRECCDFNIKRFSLFSALLLNVAYYYYLLYYISSVLHKQIYNKKRQSSTSSNALDDTQVLEQCLRYVTTDFSLEIRFDDVTVARNSATAVSKPYYSTKAHSSEPTAHARSSSCTYMLSWPLIDEKMGEEKKERKKRKTGHTVQRKEEKFHSIIGTFSLFFF